MSSPDTPPTGRVMSSAEVMDEAFRLNAMASATQAIGFLAGQYEALRAERDELQKIIKEIDLCTDVNGPMTTIAAVKAIVSERDEFRAEMERLRSLDGRPDLLDFMARHGGWNKGETAGDAIQRHFDALRERLSRAEEALNKIQRVTDAADNPLTKIAVCRELLRMHFAAAEKGEVGK